MDVIGGNDILQRRFNNFLRGGGNDVEVEAITRDGAGEQLRELPDVFLQPHTFPRLHQVLFADAGAILGVMEQEIAQFAALLHQVLYRQRRDFGFENLGRDSHQFAEDQAGIVETQGLIEIACQQILLDQWNSGLHKCPPAHVVWALLATANVQIR